MMGPLNLAVNTASYICSHPAQLAHGPAQSTLHTQVPTKTMFRNLQTYYTYVLCNQLPCLNRAECMPSGAAAFFHVQNQCMQSCPCSQLRRLNPKPCYAKGVLITTPQSPQDEIWSSGVVTKQASILWLALHISMYGILHTV